MSKLKAILCVDFDGVVHKYSNGWCDGEIYDDVTDGFFDWAIEAAKEFQLVIYSSRSKSDAGITAMREWLSVQAQKWRDERGVPLDENILFEFSHEKPPAWLTIDDRCVRFDGDWTKLAPASLRDFKPWMQR